MKNVFLRSLRWLQLVRRIPHLRHMIRLLWRLVRDRRVPSALKGMLGLTIAYFILPFDLIPESIALMLGLVDDVAIVMAGVNWFLWLAPQDAVDEHLKTLGPGFQQSFQAWRGRESRRDQLPASPVDGSG